MAVRGVRGGVALVLAAAVLVAQPVSAQGLDPLVVAGGTAAVPDAVMAPIAEATGREVVRVAGADRFETAAIASQAFAVGSPAFVASGANFPDALAGGPAAAVAGGPILLVNPDSIPASTAEALQGLAPSSITVLGGSAAVADSVVDELGGFTDGDVTVVFGAERFATAAAIAAAFFDAPVERVFVASGEAFPDALSGAQAGGLLGVPVLLTRPGDLPDATAGALDALQPGQITVLGGTAAVSDDVVAALEAHTDGAVDRLAGDTRFMTAAAVAAAMYPEGAQTAYFASGRNFPDALAIGPIAAGGAEGGARQLPDSPQDGPLFLVDDAPNDQVTQAVCEALGCDDEPPPPDNAPPVAEDVSGATLVGTAVTLDLVATDADGDALTFELVDPPVQGTAVISGSQVTYTPEPNAEGPESFTYRACDEHGLCSEPATVTVTVTAPGGGGGPVAQAPVVNLDPGGPDDPGYAVTFTEDGGAVALVDVAAATVTDVDSTQLQSLTLTLTNRPDGVLESLACAAPAGITVAAYDPGTGILTLTGAASPADYQTALRSCSYDNTDQDPDTADRVVTVVGVDATGRPSSPVTTTITVVAVNDAPVAVDDTASTAEDTPVAIDVLANDTDVDAGPDRSLGDAAGQRHRGDHRRRHRADLPAQCELLQQPRRDPDTFTYTLNAGGGSATVSVTVTCVDDAPVAVDDAATVGEDAGATAIDVLANDTDVDGGPMSSSR